MAFLDLSVVVDHALVDADLLFQVVDVMVRGVHRVYIGVVVHRQLRLIVVLHALFSLHRSKHHLFLLQ